MSAAGSSRYSPNDFAYNGRVGMALVPCLATISMLGGRSVLAVLALGSIAGYMMDVMQYRDGAYTSSWLTLLATTCAFSISVFSSSTAAIWAQISLVLVVTFVMVLCAMWASLQFKYFQMQNPAVALAFERLVITGSLPAAAVMHTIGLSLFVDVSDLAYYLAVILCLLYAHLARPLQSSFVTNRPAAPTLGGGMNGGHVGASHSKLAANSLSCIQGRVDAALMALITASLPPLLYAAIHWELLFRHPLHMHSMLLCGCVPLLVIALLPAGMWWIPGGSRAARTLQTIVLVIAMLGAVIGFEGRVLFHAFGQYIKLPPPWNWIAVTSCLLGVAAIALAAQQGVLGGSMDVTVAGSALLLCTTAGALATGVPFHWLPAPLVAACGLALFFDSRSLREYIVFVGGAFMTGVWFVLQHFWLLDIHVGGVSLHALCRMALAALLPALMLPGLVHARVPAPALDALIMLQAMMLCVLEERLYVPSHSDFSGEPMYPGYLVVATSALGILAARMLTARGHITQLGNWLAHGVYGTKAIMLLLPEAALVLPSVLLVLAATAPAFLTPLAPGSAHSSRRRVRVPVAIGLVHAVSILAALGLARFAVFDVVQFLVSSRPPEGLLLGVLVLVAAASLAPLVITCYPGHQLAQRMLATLALSGVLLALLQPPLPLRGGSRCPVLPLALCPRLWDARHVPLHDAEDAEVWGAGLVRKEHWPRWLLFVALVVGVGAGALGGAGSGPRGGRAPARSGVAAALRRLAVAGTTGCLVGLYIALEVVPNQMVLQVLVLLSCMAVVAFVCLLPLPAVRGPLILPGLAAAWLLVFGFTMLLQAELPPAEAPVDMQRLFPDSHRQVEEEIQAATRAGLLAVFASQATLLALALKLHVSATLKAQDASIAAGSEGSESMNGGGGFATLAAPGVRGADLFCGIVPLASFGKWGRSLRLEGSACGPLLQRLGGAGLSWAPSLGSACALLAYVMCVSLNVQITGGAPEALFMAAPLLLLMQQDPLLAPGLTPARRYSVPFAATCVSLLICCIASVTALVKAQEVMGIRTQIVGQAKALLPMIEAQSVYVMAAQQLLVAAAVLPGAALLTWAMWSHKALALLTQVRAGGLCALTLLVSPQPAAWYLSGLVLLSSLAHHASVQHTRRANAKII